MAGCPQQWQVIIAIDMNCDSVKGQQMTEVAKNLLKCATISSCCYCCCVAMLLLSIEM